MGWSVSNSVDEVDFNSPRYPNITGNILNRYPFPFFSVHHYPYSPSFIPKTKPPSSSLPTISLHLIVKPHNPMSSFRRSFPSPSLQTPSKARNPNMHYQNVCNPAAQRRSLQQHVSPGQRKSPREPGEFHVGKSEAEAREVAAAAAAAAALKLACGNLFSERRLWTLKEWDFVKSTLMDIRAGGVRRGRMVNWVGAWGGDYCYEDADGDFRHSW